MKFNTHSDLAGRHAALSPSTYSWLNYDEDQLAAMFFRRRAAARGTRLHNIAHLLIAEGVKLPETTKTLDQYVNDCIGWRMKTEQILSATEYAFGTADAISYRNNVLRISDLKTGENEAKEHQLEIYAAYFCIEYAIKPFDLEAIELRIYQNDAVIEYKADPVDIMIIIDRTLSFTKFLRRLEEEAAL